MKKSIYLDHAAATPMDSQVLVAMEPYFSEKFYNPSAMYSDANVVKRDLQAARALVASILGCRPTNITFTAGGTEANNLAIRGILEHYPSNNVIISSIEHESVIEPAEQYDYKLAPVNTDGIINIAKLIKLIDDKTVLVSIMYVNNEIGTIEPLRRISIELNKIRRQRLRDNNKLPLYFHSDAAQAANYLDLHVSSLGVDLLTLNGGKIYGPKQSGVLYIASHVKLSPQILGGGQEQGIRSGTENIAGSIGFATALQLTQAMRHNESERLLHLQGLLFQLLEEKLPTAVINGSRKQRIINNIHITIPGQDNERLLIQLDELGIKAAAGSACSASDEEPSHVLKAIGLSDNDAQASLRLTIGRLTDELSVRAAVKTLTHLV